MVDVERGVPGDGAVRGRLLARLRAPNYLPLSSEPRPTLDRVGVQFRFALPGHAQRSAAVQQLPAHLLVKLEIVVKQALKASD